MSGRPPDGEGSAGVQAGVSGLGGTGRYWAVAAGLAAAFLASFLLVEQADVAVLTDPRPWLEGAGAAGAVVGVGLLVADVALPVPSSLVMVTHGALFGVVTGTVLSLIGSLGAAGVAFAIGRAGGPTLDRLAGETQRRRADELLDRWGALAIVVSRPVPILAETVALLAGASRLGWGSAMVAAAVGSLPAALVYAITGAVAASFASTAVVFTLVLSAAAVMWLLGRRERSLE